MKSFFTLFLTVVLLLAACRDEVYTSERIDNSTLLYSREQLISDYNQFRNHLESNHPRLYHFASRSSLDSMFDAHLNLITDSMHISDFYVLLAPVIARIGCGHTSIWLPDGFWDTTPGLMVPLHIYVSQDERVWILRSLDSASVIPPGAELISVNNIETSKLIKTFISQLNADGYNHSLKIWKLNRQFQELFALNHGHYKSFEIEYSLNGTRSEVQLPAVSGQVIRRIINPERTDGWLYGDLKYERFDEHNAALIKLLTFAYYGENQKFHAFIDDCFRDMRENNIANLILDLRDNDGGDPFCSVHLFGYLEPEPVPYFSKRYQGYKHMADPIPRADHPFEGNLFTLINGGGQSTTGHFTSLLKYHKTGTFVGLETGATYTCNDASKMINLDNTRIYVNSPRGTFAAAVEGLPDDRGIIPDIIIEPEVEDMINGKDTELEFILNELIGEGES